MFLVLLVFLAGRVRAGADPGLKQTTTPAAQTAAQSAAQPADSAGYDSGDGSSGYDGGGAGAVVPDPSPPSTQVS